MPPDRPPFTAWLCHPDQHLREDAMGALCAALRGDPQDPTPADGRELAAYLVGRGAADSLRAVAADAWAYYLAERYAPFATAVRDWAEQWACDEPCTLPIAELLDDLDEPVPPSDPAELLCDLAPWLLLSGANIAIRVEGDLIELRCHPDLDAVIDDRYCGSVREAL